MCVVVLLLNCGQVCMQLLPVERVVNVMKMMHGHAYNDVRSHPPCSVFSVHYSPEEDGNPDSYPSIAHRDCVVFSTSTIILNKFYVLGPESSSYSVFCSNAEGLTPCHPLQPASDKSAGPPASYFILWLEEYVRRLEEGIYQFQPPFIDQPSGDVVSEVSPRMISLYPRKALYDPNDIAKENNIGATRCITRNIEVTLCPTFIPEGSIPTENMFVWSYSVMFRMLSPSDPEYIPELSGNSLTCCQLVTRHWRIFTPEDANDGEIQHIDGEGVIGHFPALRRKKDDTRHSSL